MFILLSDIFPTKGYIKMFWVNPVFQIRIGFIADPDPAYYVNADPDADLYPNPY